MATFHDRTLAPKFQGRLLRGAGPCRVLTSDEMVGEVEAEFCSFIAQPWPEHDQPEEIRLPVHCPDEIGLATARTIHSRRALARAAEHGVSLLAALDLPQIADALDVVIAHLDALDAPDEDREPWLAGYYNGQVDISGECEADDCDDEDSLGAPENHPGRWHIDMSGHYHVGRRCHPLGSQVTWGAGHPGDVEDDGDDRESEAGYDLACDEDEREDDGLWNGEHDTADAEPWLGSLEHVDQTRWAKSALSDAEHDSTDCISHYLSKTAWEAVYANRPAMNALTARARALRSRRDASRDPDTVIPVRPGVVWWEGPTFGSVTPYPGADLGQFRAEPRGADMSAAGKLIARAEEGSLDEIGACLAAIRSMSTHAGVIDEEDARAIYSLTCIALIEWRKLDEEAAKPRK